MKKFFNLLMIALLACCLVACSGGKSDAPEGGEEAANPGNLVIYSPNSDPLIEVAYTFGEKYGITVDVVSAGTGECLERIAAEKERARQEELRKQELKRQQEEAARRKEMIRLETEKRNAEISRLTELENKKLEELRNLQAKKQQQINDGQVTINRIARTGLKEPVARPASRQQNAPVANAFQVRRQPAVVNNSQGQVPQQKFSDQNLRLLDSMYVEVENSSRK